MKVLSLKLREEIFKDAETLIHEMKTKRNTYINEALDFYNKLNRRKLLRKKLHAESGLVKASSLEVLRELEGLEETGF